MTGAAPERVTLSWTGDTADGAAAFVRDHRIDAGGDGGPIAVTAGPALGGDGTGVDPERLLLAATASCLLLAFLNAAARARVAVVAYHDEALARFAPGDPPPRIERIELRPEITLATSVDDARLARLVDLAHRECTVAAALAVPVEVAPTFVVAY